MARYLLRAPYYGTLRFHFPSDFAFIGLRMKSSRLFKYWELMTGFSHFDRFIREMPERAEWSDTTAMRKRSHRRFARHLALNALMNRIISEDKNYFSEMRIIYRFVWLSQSDFTNTLLLRELSILLYTDAPYYYTVLSLIQILPRSLLLLFSRSIKHSLCWCLFLIMPEWPLADAFTSNISWWYRWSMI